MSHPFFKIRCLAGIGREDDSRSGIHPAADGDGAGVVAAAAIGGNPGWAGDGAAAARHRGDTIAVSARIWLGQRVETLVRLDGADAPELRGKCAGERQLAKRAKDFVAAFLGNGAVILRDIQYGKFAGRVVSRIFALDGRDLAEALIARGLAHSYAGGRRRNWCV